MDVKEAAVEYLPEVAPQSHEDDVPPGYKRTEVGVIPEDWDALKMEQLARGILRGASPRPIDSPVWFDETSPIGWVRISDVTRTTRHLSETQQHLSKRGVARSRYVPSGSLIMSICATVGKPIETCFNVCIHDGFVVFERPSADQGFLYHLLKDLEPQWSTKGQTGSQMNLNTGLIKNTVVPVPSSEHEQRVIATALSDADALIAALQRLIAKKRAIKQGTMQALLTGRQRLPGFTGEWETQSLSAICSMKSGDAITDARIDDGSAYPCYGGNGLRGYTKSFTHDGKYALIGRQGALCGNVLLVNGRFFASEHAVVVTADREVCIDWLAIILERMNLNRLSESSAQPGLSVSKILELGCAVPTYEEQTAIATVLADMDAEIEVLEARLAKTRALKAGMMQQLLTGRIRLPLEDAA